MKLSLDGVLARRIITLSGPVVAAMISQTLINNIDHILVGRLPREESIPGQTAVQYSLTLLWAVGGSLSAIGVGTQALTARRYGAGDVEGAGRVLTNSASIAVFLGIIASVLFVFLAPSLLPLINKDPSVVRLGVPFLQYRYAAVASMVITASYKAFFDGLGRTHVHFVVALVMNLLNLVLNIALIFGKWGFPRMGVAGSGLASCISSYFGMLLIIAWSFKKDVRRFHLYSASKLDGGVSREIVRLSAPSSAAVVFSLIGFMVFFFVVAVMDKNAGHAEPFYGAATSNIINIFMLVFISCMAYGTATATLVGQNMAAHDYDKAERFAFEAAKIGALFYALFGLAVALFPEFVLTIWCKDLPVIAVASPILRVLALFAPLMCVALVFTYALYGAGNSLFVMKVEGTLHGLCLIPLSYILALPLGFGLWGAWGAMIAYVVLMAGIMAWKFSEGSWKEIKI